MRSRTTRRSVPGRQPTTGSFAWGMVRRWRHPSCLLTPRLFDQGGDVDDPCRLGLLGNEAGVHGSGNLALNLGLHVPHALEDIAPYAGGSQCDAHVAGGDITDLDHQGE